MMFRRTAMALLAFGLGALTAPVNPALALDYPTRPVRFIVGYPAGGSTDIIARLIGQRLSERLGQQFVIENKPGAGNNIGTETVVKAEPDGYTVLLVNPANFINASLYTNLNFNFIRDIAPVAGMCGRGDAAAGGDRLQDAQPARIDHAKGQLPLGGR